ncbi:MAG: hypothetical protein ACPHCN_12690 [Mycobacterium sp.]
MMGFPTITDDQVASLTAYPGKVWVSVEQWSDIETTMLMPTKSENKQRSTERQGTVLSVNPADRTPFQNGDHVHFRYAGGQSFRRESGQVVLVVPTGNVEMWEACANA